MMMKKKTSKYDMQNEKKIQLLVLPILFVKQHGQISNYFAKGNFLKELEMVIKD